MQLVGANRNRKSLWHLRKWGITPDSADYSFLSFDVKLYKDKAIDGH